MALEKCKNCERTIGNLETPYLFEEEIVCKHCFEELHGTRSLQTIPQNVVTRVPVREKVVIVQQPIRTIPTVQPIERTGKKWKGMMVISVVMIIIGGIAVIPSGPIPIPFLLFLPLGIFLFIVAKICAWWCHG